MKVLHVINSLTSGGAENLVSVLAKKQSKFFTSNIFSFDTSNDLFNEFEDSNVKYISGVSNSYFSFSNLKLLNNQIRKHEVIHVHLFPSFYIVAFISLFYNSKKFVLTEHNTHNRRRESKFFKIVEKLIYSRYKSIICISQSVKEELRNWQNTKDKAIVIENFIDINKIQSITPINRESVQGTNAKLLTMVGRFTEQKDQITLIKALKLLPVEFKLLLIGEGERRKEVEAYISACSLSDRVHILGVRNDVFSILKICDFGILSSNWEGFGIAAIEYMASNIIALGTNVKGLNEVIPLSENLFQVGDYKGLAEMIMRIDSSPSKKEEILKVQNSWVKKFDIQQAFNRHLEVYSDLLYGKI